MKLQKIHAFLLLLSCRKKQESRLEELTTARPDKTVHDYESLRKGSAHKAVFAIANTEITVAIDAQGCCKLTNHL